MAKLTLSPGNIVYMNNKKYEIRKPSSLTTVLVKDVQTEKIEEVPISRLRGEPGVTKGAVTKGLMPEAFLEKHWEVAKRRYDIIKPLLKKDRTRKEVVDRGKEFGIGLTALYDWIKRYEAFGTLTQLVPGYTDRGGKGKEKINKETEAIIKKTLDDALESGARTKFKSIMKNINIKCRNAGVNPPHENTVRRRFSGRSKRKVMEITEGKEKSRHETRPLRGKHEVRLPLDEIQIDETPLDVIIVDETFRRPIGRAFGTFATDVASRVVYGFYLSLEHPSFFTFGQCMGLGILPKDAYLRSLGVNGRWDVWGLPKGATLHYDNAKFYRGKDMKLFCEQYGVSVTFRPRKTPECGGHIERLIKTINEALHELPGATFSNPEQKGDYESEKMAVMTYNELERWLADFIVNIYHQKEHSSLDGMSPMQRWEMGLMGNESMPGIGLPDIIQGDDADNLRMSLLPSVYRTIQRATVTIDNIPYFHEVLIAVSDKVTSKKNVFHLFKRDPRDISFLYYFDPDRKEYFKIHYRNIGWPAVSIWEWRKAKKYLRDNNVRTQNPDRIFETYIRLQKIEEEAAQKTKAARRAREMKRIHAGQKAETTTSSNKKQSKKKQDDKLKSIFESAKPVSNIKIVGKWKKEEYY